MSEYYIPIFRRQIGDPTTDRDAYICTMSSGAMALDYHTLGKIQVWGGQLEKCQDDHVGGSDLYDLRTAWKRCHNQTLEIRSGQGWAGVKRALAEGRAVVIQGDYDQMGSYSCQASFLGGHAEVLIPSTTRWARVGDPLCRGFKDVPEKTMKAYAEKLASGVLFAVTAAHAPLEDEMGLTVYLTATKDSVPWDDFGTAKLTSGPILRVSDGAAVAMAGGTNLGTVQKGTWDGKAIYALNHSGQLHIVEASKATFAAMSPPSGPSDCTAEVAAATAPLKVEIGKLKDDLAECGDNAAALQVALDKAPLEERTRIANAERNRILNT